MATGIEKKVFYQVITTTSVYNSGQPTTLYTVPAGRLAVITWVRVFGSHPVWLFHNTPTDANGYWFVPGTGSQAWESTYAGRSTMFCLSAGDVLKLIAPNNSGSVLYQAQISGYEQF